MSANSHSIDLELSSSQYLSITDANQTGLDIAGDITLEAWIKPESITNTSSLLTKYDGGGTQISYLVVIDSSSKISAEFSSNGTYNSGSFVQYKSNSAVVSTGSWQHIAVTFSPSTNTCVMYYNGATTANTKTSGTTIGSTLYNGTAPFFIGAFGITPSGYFDGLIDEARVWNDIRTPTEISDNYQKELVGDEANLQGYWKLNNSLLDETSNNNDLTNNNSAVFSTDVPFVGGFTLIVETLALTLTFGATLFKRTLKFIIDTLSLTLTFNATLFKRGVSLIIDTLSMNITFNDIILTTANAFKLVVDTLALTLTFGATTFKRTLNFIIDTLSMTLTFNDVNFVWKRAYKLVIDTLSLTLTFFEIRLKGPTRWINAAKNATSWTNKSKNTTTWTNKCK